YVLVEHPERHQFDARELDDLDARVLARAPDAQDLLLRVCARHPEAASRVGTAWATILARLGRWRAAADACGVAVASSPDDPTARHHLILSLLAAGDGDAARQACAELLDRFGTTADRNIADKTVWAAVLVPAASDRANVLVRLSRNSSVDTRGAALYRS